MRRATGESDFLAVSLSSPGDGTYFGGPCLRTASALPPEKGFPDRVLRSRQDVNSGLFFRRKWNPEGSGEVSKHPPLEQLRPMR